MRRWLAIALLLVSIASEPQTASQQLSVHAEIKSQRYCEVDEEIYSLRVSFRIRMVNTRTSAVFVSQKIYPVVLVSRTLDDVRSGRHELEIHPGDVFPQPSPSSGAIQKEQSERRVVRPGEKLEAETMEAVVPTAKTGNYSKLEALGPGVHWAQLVMSVNGADAATFISATSQPMKVKVEQYPKSEKCE